MSGAKGGAQQHHPSRQPCSSCCWPADGSPPRGCIVVASRGWPSMDAESCGRAACVCELPKSGCLVFFFLGLCLHCRHLSFDFHTFIAWLFALGAETILEPSITYPPRWTIDDLQVLWLRRQNPSGLNRTGSQLGVRWGPKRVS
jgi:hypothetical protein